MDSTPCYRCHMYGRCQVHNVHTPDMDGIPLHDLRASRKKSYLDILSGRYISWGCRNRHCIRLLRRFRMSLRYRPCRSGNSYKVHSVSSVRCSRCPQRIPSVSYTYYASFQSQHHTSGRRQPAATASYSLLPSPV